LVTDSLKANFEDLLIPPITQKLVKIPALKGVEDFGIAKPVQ